MNLQARMYGRSVAVLALLALGGCSSGLRKGAMAPDFSLNNMAGQTFTLSSYRGNVVLLTYWAVG